MKQRLIIVFLALASCVKLHEPVEWRCSELAAIDSLMWRQPDSALACLLPYFDTCCRDAMIASPETPDGDFMETHAMRLYNRHYAQLLLAELLYKNDYAQTNRSELLQAVAYFDSLLTADTRGVSLQGSRRRDASHASAKTSAFLDARAHYINGVGYYENDSVVEACAEYLKALETMENHFPFVETRDFAFLPTPHIPRFMAYIYNRLGDLFSDQFMMKPSIDCYNNSLVFNEIEPVSADGISILLYHIGLEYDKMGDVAKARQYYERAKEEMPCLESINYRDMMALIAFSDYQLGLGIEQSLQKFREVLKQTNDESEKLTRYLTIGYIYFENEIFDSAMCYLKPVFAYSEDLVSQIQAAEYLKVIYDSIGEKEKLDECIRFLAQYKKIDGEDKALVSQLDDLFQHYMKKKQEIQTEKEQRKAVRKVVVMVVPFAFVVIITTIVLAKRKGVKRVEAERQAHKIKQAALSGRLKQRNEEVSKLKNQIRQQKEEMPFSTKTQAGTLAEETICRLIMDRVKEGQFLSQMDCRIYKNYALDTEQLTALRRAVDCHYNQFTMRISKAYPELTRSDLDYCCLYLLGLTDADVAALMQRAYNTINERNSKLRKIFGCENPLSVTLQAIADEKKII